MVRVIFVPVSPSGTGKTLSSFIYSLLLLILFAPDIKASLNVLAFISTSDITAKPPNGHIISQLL